MQARYLLLLTLLPLLAWADAATLDQKMRQLEQGRDLAAMQALIEHSTPAVLASPEGYFWRVQTATLARQNEQARQLLTEGLEQYPDSSRLVLQHSSLLSEGVGESGNFGRLRLAREIRDSLVRAVELDPDSIHARQGLIMFYLNAPRLAGGGADRAEPHLAFMRERSPMDYLDLRGAMAMGQGEMAAAVEQFEQATGADPERQPRFAKALALISLERYDQARSVLQDIVERFPQHAGAWYQLGRISALDGNELKAGRAALARFLDLPAWPGDPSAAAAWWRIGQLHQHGGDLEQARIAFEQAVAESPDFEPASEALNALDG